MSICVFVHSPCHFVNFINAFAVFFVKLRTPLLFAFLKLSEKM